MTHRRVAQTVEIGSANLSSSDPFTNGSGLFDDCSKQRVLIVAVKFLIKWREGVAVHALEIF